MVAACFVTMFTVYGVFYSFGVFFAPMARDFHAGAGPTALVFGVASFCNFLSAAATGVLADRLGPRPLVLTGAAAMGIGLMVTAAAPSIWLGYTAYGVGVGVGVACGNVPMGVAVAGWFHRRRALAVGVASAGISAGTLVVAPVAALLVQRFGWRPTEAAFGLASLVLMASCGLVAERPPLGPVARGSLRGIVRSRAFLFMYGSGAATAFALFVAYGHVVPFATRLGVAPVAAAGLLSLIGVGGLLGRPVLGIAGQRLRAVRAFQLSLAALALSFVIWLLAPSFPVLATFALVFGLGYGGWSALIPSVTAELFDVARLGSAVGLLSTSIAIGALAGPAVAGLTVDATGGYADAILLGFGSAVLGGLLALGLPPRPRQAGEAGAGRTTSGRVGQQAVAGSRQLPR
jgi:MFS family permease